MTVPNGEPGITPPDFGVTADGSIPAMPGLTQTPVEDFYKAKVQASPSWSASSPIFTAVINALIDGAIDIFGEDIGATLSEIIEALTGVEDGDSGDVGSFANLLLGRDESLASRVARIENKIALGAEFFDDFNRGDNDTVIGNGWSQGGDGQGLGIHDQAVQIKRDLLPDDGTRYAICPQVADGDNFTVAAVIHPAGVAANPETVLYARANTGFTAGVCVRMRVRVDADIALDPQRCHVLVHGRR